MNEISQYVGQCVQVFLNAYPNVLTWTFEDGTVVQTHDLDLSEHAGRALITAHAVRLGLGDRREIWHHLRGRHAEGVLLPLNHDFEAHDDEFPVV